MTVNLLEKDFDLYGLMHEIHMFEMIKGEESNYIVMSEHTEEAIEHRYRVQYVEEDVYFKNNKRHIGKIFGIPIAHYYNLPFGTVDIV